MSEIEGGEKPVSPDYFAKPKGGNGGKRLNNKLLYVVAGVALLILAVLVVAAYARGQAASVAEAEVPKVSSVAVPPVKRPPGPDVNFPTEPRAAEGHGYPTESAPAMEDEVLKQARVRKAEAMYAALVSSPSVEGFASNQGKGGYSSASNSGMHGTPGSRGLGSPPPPPPDYADEYGEGRDGGDINNQAGKRAFFEKAIEGGLYLKNTRVAPLSPYQISAGWLIPGSMISGINSDLPGECLGQVRQDVFDSATGETLLIPAGSKITCVYDSSVSPGQESALVAFKEIKYPDGSSLNLEGMPGANQSGFAGFDDQVDNHYLRMFGTAAMLSVISAGTMLSAPRGNTHNGGISAQQIMAASLGQQLGMLGMQTVRRNMMIQPTIKIRPGYKFTIMVTKDIVLPPYVRRVAGGY